MEVGLADEKSKRGECDDTGSDLASHERAHIAFVFSHHFAVLIVAACIFNVINLLDALEIRG